MYDITLFSYCHWGYRNKKFLWFLYKLLHVVRVLKGSWAIHTISLGHDLSINDLEHGNPSGVTPDTVENQIPQQSQYHTSYKNAKRYKKISAGRGAGFPSTAPSPPTAI